MKVEKQFPKSLKSSSQMVVSYNKTSSFRRIATSSFPACAASVAKIIIMVVSLILQSSITPVTAFSHSAWITFSTGQHQHPPIIRSSLFQSYDVLFGKRPTALTGHSAYSFNSTIKTSVEQQLHRNSNKNAPQSTHSPDCFQYAQDSNNKDFTDSFDPLHLGKTSARSIGYAQHALTSSINEFNDSSASSTATSKTPGILSEVWRARFLLLIAAGLYGTNFTIVKILNEHMPFGASTSLRFILATLATLPFLFPSFSSSNAVAGGALTSWSDVLPVVLMGMEVGFFNAVAYIFQAVGLETVDASKSAFICSLSVVVVPILDVLFKKKSLSVQSLVGLLCAVVGVGLLELSGTNLSLTAGDLFTFAQPLFFGIGIWKMEEAMHRYPMEAKRITASQVLMVAICSVVNCLIIQPYFGTGCQPPSVDQVISWVTNPSILGALLWTGVITTALTQYLETLGLKTLSAAESTLWFSTEPLWGAGFASVVSGERLGLNAIYGAGLILSGCAISTTQKTEDMDTFKEKPVGKATQEEEEECLSLTPYFASLALQVQVAEGCLKEAVLEGEEFIHADNGVSSSVASAVADAINTNAIEGSVGQLPNLVDTLLK